MFEQSDEEEESPQRKDENLKRKSADQGSSPSKKGRVDDNDSGYLTPGDVSQNSDLLSNIIMENIGEVNMLNDSLDLFNDSIKNVDLLNEMYEKVEDEDRSQLVDHLKPKAVEKPVKHYNFEELLKEAMEGLVTNEKEDKSEKKVEVEHQNDMRKIFRGPFQNFQPTFQVIHIEESLVSNLYQVTLSDGVESSRNFYFKSRASQLKVNQMIKIKQLRYVASKICVETFESLDIKPGVVGSPTSIEEEYFREIRSSKVESFELSDIESPKTIMEYICLEENLRTFMERNGFYPEDKDRDDTSKTHEILFRICQEKVKVSSKILKILSKLLRLEKEEIENLIIESHSKLENSSQMIEQDHSYFSVYQCLAHSN